MRQRTMKTETALRPLDTVSIFSVTQATGAIFTDLYFRLTFLFFIQVGSKRVICPINGEVTGRVGDVMVFPTGSLVSMENRPLRNRSYRAEGVGFAHDMVATVFADQRLSGPVGVQILQGKSDGMRDMLSRLRDTLDDNHLVPPLKRHRLLEPLIWLRHNGIKLPLYDDERPLNRVQNLLATDLSHPWRVPDVAAELAMSEATFRRWLKRSGQSFSKILLTMRLEKGLTLLQTTDISISHIAMSCGFATPSHFSDSFKKRFGLQPTMIRSSQATGG